MSKRLIPALVAAIAVALVVPAHALAAVPPATEGLDPVANGLTVLTCNTHLFKDSSAEVGAWFRSREGKAACTPPLVFDDDLRAAQIANNIKSCGADIVALQEVWAYKRQEWFVKTLQNEYPHHFFASYSKGRDVSGALKKTLAKILAMKFKELNKEDARQALKCSSGLLLLSKYKLKDAEFYPFPDKRTQRDQDQWATKGVISVTVEPWPGGPTFRVGITHANTDVGGADLPDIKDLAANTVGTHKGPAIMMGDLNVHAKKEGEGGKGGYEMMRDIFQSVGAIDAYRKLHNNQDENAFTVNWKKNPLHRIFSNIEGAGTCLDYMFVKESGPGLTLTPEKAEVIRNWQYDRKLGWSHVYGRSRTDDYVAVRSFQLKGRPYLFWLKKNDQACISRINDDGRGFEDVFWGKWSSHFVGTAITTFQLNGHPHVFALKKKIPFRSGDRAYIARIKDDGKGWDFIWDGKWSDNYVAVCSFQLKGHPYLFCLKKTNTAYIRRIKDDGRGYEDVFQKKRSSWYVPTAITAFQLNGHPYLFALKRGPAPGRSGEDRAYIIRINDDGKGWTDIHAEKRSHDYTAVVSFQLNNHPYLFGLKENDKGIISRINDDGKGWEDVFEGPWNSKCVGAAVTSFSLDGQPYVFTLKKSLVAEKSPAFAIELVKLPNEMKKEGWTPEQFITPLLRDRSDGTVTLGNEAWFTRLQMPETVEMDLSDHYPIWVKFKVVRE